MFNINVPPNKSEPIRKTVGSTNFELSFDRNTEIKSHPEIAFFTGLYIRNNEQQTSVNVNYGRSRETSKVDIIAPGTVLPFATAPDKVWLQSAAGNADITVIYEYYTSDIIVFAKNINRDIMVDALSYIMPQIQAIVEYKFVKMLVQLSDEDLKKFIERFKKYPGGNQ